MIICNTVLSNFWLKNDENEVFHAFLKTLPGSPSVCGNGIELNSLESINIPHNRSKCCIVCVDALYGTDFTKKKDKA